MNYIEGYLDVNGSKGSTFKIYLSEITGVYNLDGTLYYALDVGTNIGQILNVYETGGAKLRILDKYLNKTANPDVSDFYFYTSQESGYNYQVRFIKCAYTIGGQTVTGFPVDGYSDPSYDKRYVGNYVAYGVYIVNSGGWCSPTSSTSAGTTPNVNGNATPFWSICTMYTKALPYWSGQVYRGNNYVTVLIGNYSYPGGGSGGTTTSTTQKGGNTGSVVTSYLHNTTSYTINEQIFSTDTANANYVGGSSETGLISIYHPSKSDIKSFASWLWSTSAYDSIVKMISDPLQNIIAFNMFPFTVPDSGKGYVKFGGAVVNIGGEQFNMKYCNTQFVTLDMGSYTVPYFWNNVLDYSPYTKCSIYLPFIGFQNLDTDEVMGMKLSLKYNVDLLTGDCVANIYVEGETDDTTLAAPLYSFQGNCALSVPLSSSNAATAYLAAATAAAGAVIGTATTTGGALADTALGKDISKSLGESIPSASSVMSGKVQYTRSGSIKGTAGFLAAQSPFLIVQRPIQSLPEDYASDNGYPANYTATLNTLSGFTKVSKIHLAGVHCTDAELEEIYRLLEEGVII